VLERSGAARASGAAYFGADTCYVASTLGGRRGPRNLGIKEARMRLSLVSRVVMATATLVGVLSAAAPARAGRAAAEHYATPHHRINHSPSTNWSGYAVSGFGPYQSVSSSWRQPAVDCSLTPTAWSAFWVGLDGDTTNTVEQTGTEADCSKGAAVYYAWY